MTLQAEGGDPSTYSSTRRCRSCSLPTRSSRGRLQVYSFAKHARLQETTTIYSCHVLILEGIFALYDPRVLELLDMKVRTSLVSVQSWRLNPRVDLRGHRCGCVSGKKTFKRYQM